MRTALILLFLLAVAAVPGSLLPQRPLNPDTVNAYIADHGAWGTFLDRIGMFDVFGSVWFAAVYLLLAVSLVGCLVPRIRVYARALARRPLPAPKYLSRLPESGRFETADDPGTFTAAARQTLGRKWRVEQRSEGGTTTLAAEKGYSREGGNLVFHVALLASLLFIAVGRLWSYEGSVVVVEGRGFCNTVASFDQWKPGRLAAAGDVQPGNFCIDRLDSFTAKYGSGGAPESYRADVTYRADADSDARERASITVNNPLRLDGDRVYLINHGYAPTVTVRMPDGRVQTTTAAFLPTNATTYLSEGAYKFFGAEDAGQDVGIAGSFAPTPVQSAPGFFASASPVVRNPVLGLAVYTGTINRYGEPESVYRLNPKGLTQTGVANLRIGQTRTVGNGVTVTFDGYKQWASLQVSHDPAQGWLLASAAAMVLGLGLSLGVRRRRLWIRVTPPPPDAPESPTVVTVGGLARSDSGSFTDEFAHLVVRLRDAGHASVPDGEAMAAVGTSRESQ